ncbi:MAG: transporter substrate-binding domain-containing protein, partial [Pseudomonadota bacterium]
LEDARARSAIVVEKGTTADVLLTRHGFKNVVRVSTPEASARMLESGRAEAWFQDDRLMQQTWEQLGLAGRLQVGAYTHEVPIYLVASPGLPNDVTDAYRNAIAAMRDDGTLDRLWQSYLLIGG